MRLGRRDQSSRDLSRALARDGIGEDEIEAVIHRLSERRLLDDVAFAERYSRRQLARGVGRKRIGVGLKTRGIARDDAARGLAQALELYPEETTLEAVARSYWRRHTRLEPRQRARRLLAFLLRRGFPIASILPCMRRICPAESDSVEQLAVAEESS